MSDEMNIDGKTYISSKRASSLSGYAQDYIGQLCRAGILDARRVGGLWFVTLESLERHKVNAEQLKVSQALALSKNQKPKEQSEQESFVALDGKQYISAHRAAKVSGYSQDYIGQLARSAKINSRQVGNRWYVEQESLLAHKHEKDSLLASVQASSVGIQKETVYLKAKKDDEPLLSYFSDDKDLVPYPTNLASAETEEHFENNVTAETTVSIHDLSINKAKNIISIQKDIDTPVDKDHLLILRPQRVPAVRGSTQPWGKTLGLLTASALTIVVVVSFGFENFRAGAQYAAATSTPNARLTAFIGALVEPVLQSIEDTLSPPPMYKR